MLARSASFSKHLAGFIALRDSEKNVSLRLMGAGNPHVDGFGKEGMGNLCQAAGKMAATFPDVVSLPDASTVSLCEFAKELAAVKRINFLLIDDIGFAFDGTEYPDKQGALMERIARLRDLARSLQIPVVASVTLDLSNVCEGLPVAALTPEEILKYSSADFLAVLTEIRYSAGDRIHEFEILRNPFGPTAKVPLVYHNKSQRFYELSEKDDE